jgi:hypothetical protein
MTDLKTDATDDEILDYCDKNNPAGTTNGWGHVIRNSDRENMNPVQCADDSNRLHILVQC